MDTGHKLTLIIIKPDLEERGLVGELLAKLDRDGIEIVSRGLVRFDLELIRLFYQWDVITHPVQIGGYLCSESLRFWILQGDDAVSRVNRIKQEMRQEFNTNDRVRNLLHCPDSPEGFWHECAMVLKQQSNKGGAMPEIKTNNQVEVILFQYEKDGTPLFLILKRVPRKGGFWQPITGNVRVDETFGGAALREMQEETGVIEALEIINTEYSFDFFDDGRNQHEKVFGIRVHDDVHIRLSDEHSEFQWVTKDEALKRYLKYPGNKTGLSKLCEKLGV